MLRYDTVDEDVTNNWPCMASLVNVFVALQHRR